VTVLAIVRHYLPLFQSGGPARTLANLVERLGDELQFSIITSDRSVAGGDGRSDEVLADRWNRVDKANVYYASRPNRSVRGLARLIRETPHDILYINSFFDSVFTVKALLARRLGLLPHVPAVLAPRGEFSPAALDLDRWRKVPYLAVALRAGLYRDLVWQASSEREAADIRRTIGGVAESVIVAPNLPRLSSDEPETVAGRPPGAALRVVFLSRIVPMKNLAYALRVLRLVRARVDLSIYGPVRDEGYWRECRRLLDCLPDNVKAEYRGEVPSVDVPRVLRSHDLFFLPTRGENYGHAIAEALSVGTPVLIADTTYWRGLEEAGVGWDLPLADQGRFARCVDYCAGLGSEEYAAWRERIRRHASDRMQDEGAVDANRRLFETAIAR
jgi:glycosyltransferase involved in cell wall biosynthesis